MAFWIAIGILAFSIRLAFVTQFAPDREWSDAAVYDSIAQNLLSGDGYSIDGIEPTRDRPPTYPLFLAAIYAFMGRDLAAIVVVQSLLAVLTALMTGWLASQLFDHRTGFVAAVLVATYPALIYYDTRILREGFTAFLLVATLCSAWRARNGGTINYLVTGVGVTLISLCRPETLVLSIPAVLIASGPGPNLSRMLRPGIFVLIPILLGWIPWTVRNQQIFGSWSPVKAGIVSTIWYGSRWAETGGDDQTAEDREALKQQFQIKAQGAGDAELEERFKDDLSSDILDRPLWFLKMVGKKAVMFWKDANGVRRTLPRIHEALPALLNTYYYALLILAVTAMFIGRKRWSIRVLFSTIVIYWATYALLHVRNRYRVPILPIVFVFSSAGITFLWSIAITWLRATVRGDDSK